jgi:transcriptional regulator with XRE-family HTH domain
MGNFSLMEARKALGLRQREMARRMGLSLRPYQQLESNPDKVRPRHVRLAESVALDVAIEKENLELVPASVRKKVMNLAGMILRRNFRQKAGKIAAIILEQE